MRKASLPHWCINAIVNKSKLVAKYNQSIDSESAYEILTAKLQEAADRTQAQQQQVQQQKAQAQQQKSSGGFFQSSAVKQVERTAASIITRSLLGALGLGGKSKRLW
jgi:ABC-type nitrate/sulfonate/bicarbonate transport system substrate-binding protein